MEGFPQNEEVTEQADTNKTPEPTKAEEQTQVNEAQEPAKPKEAPKMMRSEMESLVSSI